MLSLLVCACAGARGGTRGPTTRIEGHIHGHDGRVPSLAHARVIDAATQQPLAQVQADKQGGFALKSRQHGLAWLELTAVDHAQLRVPILLDGTALSLEATLGTYGPGDPAQPVQLIAWHGDPQKAPPTTSVMKRGTDGSLVGELTTAARTMRVQLINLAGGGRQVNPPHAKRYEYDGGGDYLGFVDAEGGALHVVVRPEDVPNAAAPQLVFTPADAPAARVAALGELWPTLLRAPTPDDITALWERARTTDDALVRRIATAMALTIERRGDAELTSEERTLATALITSTPFGDPLWPFMPDGVARAAELTGDPAHTKLLDRVIAEQLGPEQSGMVLLGRLAHAYDAGDEPRARALYARIGKSPYLEMGLAEMAAAWNPDRKLKPGATLPRFEAGTLDPKTRVGSEDLRGKLVLIELWATWCQPCVDGMDELHALHREFGGEPSDGRPRFEILSISMDEQSAEVQTFRERWPMPWLHAFAGDQREQLYATFETATLPYTVLVDADGKVLEASAAVEPGQLRAWLEKHGR
jgi:thiol-disulfide isomerase/thioredoxin